MAYEVNVVTPVTPDGLLDICRTLHEHDVHIKDLLSMLKGGNNLSATFVHDIQGLEDRMRDQISALDARLVNLEKSGPQQLDDTHADLGDSLHVPQELEDQMHDQITLQDARQANFENCGPPKLDARHVSFENGGPPKLDDIVPDQGESLHQGRAEKETADVASIGGMEQRVESSSPWPLPIGNTGERLETLEAEEHELEKKAEELVEKENALEKKVQRVESSVERLEGVLDPKEANSTYLKRFNFHREYSWETSVFDAMFLICTIYTETRHSALIALGYMWNLFMVAMTIGVLSSDEFVDDSVYNRDPIQNWRDMEAHMIYNADPRSQMTLATRVCGKDLGLSLAIYQRNLYQEAEKYIESGGYVLCVVAVSLWSTCCLTECRQALNFLVAIACLPRGSETHFKADATGLEFIVVPMWRVLLGFFVATVRIVIAISLLIYGSAWLTHTISMENLLLNASALSFVLEVDETIFACLAPLRVKSLLQAMHPLQLPSYIWFKNLSSIMFALLVFLLIFQCVFFIEKTADFVRDVTSIVCEPEGSGKYVMSMSALGWIMYTKNTKDWGDELAQGHQQHQNIMSSLIKGGELSQYAVDVKRFDLVEHAYYSSVAEFVDDYDCRDYNLMAANAGVGKRLWAVTGNSSLYDLADCHEAQAKGLCLDLSIVGINVRFMCAQTCGCSDMHAGLWDIATSDFGCPQKACKKRLVQRLGSMDTKCVDQGATALTKTGWAWMVDRMKVTENISQAIHSNLMNLGCEALKDLHEDLRILLCSIHESDTKHGAAPFCPTSCECPYRQCHGLCPLSCCHS